MTSSNRISRTDLITHCAAKGHEEMQVIVHGAVNVPYINQQQIKPYCTVQSKHTLRTQNIGSKPNATNAINGSNPLWNDLIFVSTTSTQVDSEELIIFIIDEIYNRNLAEFRIPWTAFEPFIQYHLELTLDNYTKNTLLCYVSVIRKKDVLANRDLRYFALELLLTKFEVPFVNNEEIYAVGRIVPDLEEYKKKYLKPDTAFVKFTPVTPLSTKKIYERNSFTLTGFPQVSLASYNGKWNHSFIFATMLEKEFMFKNDAAVVVEFYARKKILGKSWSINDPMGWVFIRLDKRCLKSLETDAAKDIGLQTYKMLVETDGSLQSSDPNQYLTCGSLIKLHRDSVFSYFIDS
jgi:hypothetical protein